MTTVESSLVAGLHVFQLIVEIIEILIACLALIDRVIFEDFRMVVLEMHRECLIVDELTILEWTSECADMMQELMYATRVNILETLAAVSARDHGIFDAWNYEFILHDADFQEISLERHKIVTQVLMHRDCVLVCEHVIAFNTHWKFGDLCDNFKQLVTILVSSIVRFNVEIVAAVCA